jgi:hypothetical protein
VVQHIVEAEGEVNDDGPENIIVVEEVDWDDVVGRDLFGVRALLCKEEGHDFYRPGNARMLNPEAILTSGTVGHVRSGHMPDHVSLVLVVKLCIPFRGCPSL